MTYKQPPDCDCEVCQEMCNRPCGPSPKEARALIDAGHGDKLELRDFCFEFNGEWVSAWMLVIKKQWLPLAYNWGKCVFFDGRHCEIHGDLKPLEGKMADHGESRFDRDKDLYPLWLSDEAQELAMYE
jgi:hypothetical protein